MGNMCTDEMPDRNQKAHKKRKGLSSQYSEYQDTEIKQIKEFLTLTSQNTSSFNIDAQPIPALQAPPKAKSINDFKILRALGRGAFGRVMLAQDITDGKLYAMKILEKNSIKTKQEKLHTLSERYILEAMENQFIVRLHYAFQNSKKLYLLVDFLAGGELFYLLRRSGRFNEQIAKFYAAQLLLALQYLHSRNIIYRDIKPQNILLDRNGHIKLTDFGLSKVCYAQNQTTYSMCGTPEYIAPEIISGRGYNQSADWFSFGSVLYDMLTGKPPFYSKNKSEILKNVTTRQVPLPEYLSQDAKSLLRGLFQIDPKKRLGSSRDANQIKQHPFFKKIDFTLLSKLKIKPPFNFQGQSINLQGFDTNLNKNIQPESLVKEEMPENGFEGFTYQKSYNNMMSPQTLHYNLENSKNFVIAPADADE